MDHSTAGTIPRPLKSIQSNPPWFGSPARHPRHCWWSHTHTHKCASSFTKNSVDRVFGVRYGRFRHKCSCLSDASLINTVQPKLVARLPLHHTSPDFVHPWAQTLSIVLGASQGAQPTLARCEFQHHEKLCLIAGILLQLSPS